VDSPPLAAEVAAYYARGGESRRLFEGHGRIELLRTQELILRHLPRGRAVVLDVGGGTGVYACWLAARQPEHPLASATVGDARRLEAAAARADVVLLLGPLYHLIARGERVAALVEARRVLRPGGLVFAVGIARFASLFSGVVERLLDDPNAQAIVERDLVDGQHRNPTDRDYFTTSYFHLPHELEAEVRAAGFATLELVGVEGPGWLLPDLDARWRDPAERERLLWAARALEREPTLLGLSAHVLVVGRKPTD